MRSLPAYLRPLWLVLIVALGCSGDPTGPTAASLTVSVLGLPGGSSASITVTGPGGFSQPVTATHTFTQLTRGTYTIAATNVTVGTSDYQPSPQTQTVVVNGSTNASVSYGPVTGNLTVTINGLGTSSTAAVTVTGPGYTQSVTATTTLTGLTPGVYSITAQNVTASCGATSYVPTPGTQNRTVSANTTASDTVTYDPPTGGLVNFCIRGMYVTQSTQTFGGAVPLVKNRQGYLRIFVIADRANNALPQVRVRLFNPGPILDTLVSAPVGAVSVPTAVDESSLNYSWNVPLPGSRIQPGLTIQAQVDPSHVIPESDTTDNVFPASGNLGTNVLPVPTLNVTFVPVIQSTSGLQGNVSNANKDAFLDLTKRMHPIDGVNAVVGAPMPTSTTLQADGTGWATVLSEIETRRVADSTFSAYNGYYYGVAKVSYSSGVAGVAYVRNPSGPKAALGWDDPGTRGGVVAHELGHNWGRNHAPCGNPANLDPNYPYSGGTTGVYGLDLGSPTPTLEPPTTSDIMGYCRPQWISDYNYRAVLNYFSGPNFFVTSADVNPSVQPCLLVWGHIANGELVLEPAFQVTTRPRLPSRPGPYSLEARADDGTTLFALSFTPDEVADARQSQQNFVFAVPLSETKAARLSSLHVAGRGREAVLSSAIPAPTTGARPQAVTQSDLVQLRRVAGGRLSLRWDSQAHPMVMVRDAATGKVLSFARGGDAQVLTRNGQVDLVLSDGVKSRMKRVQVPR